MLPGNVGLVRGCEWHWQSIWWRPDATLFLLDDTMLFPSIPTQAQRPTPDSARAIIQQQQRRILSDPSRLSNHIGLHSLCHSVVSRDLCSFATAQATLCYMNHAIDGQTLHRTSSNLPEYPRNWPQNRHKLEKMAITMHCNLRPLDVVPVVLGFNYEAYNGTSLQIQHGRNLLWIWRLAFLAIFLLRVRINCCLLASGENSGIISRLSHPIS